ncbi:unnamed protein product [Ectocarpus sp. 12 AP-2014]
MFNTSSMVLVMVVSEKTSCRLLCCLFLVDLLMLELGSARCHLQITLCGAAGWSTLTDKLSCGGKQGRDSPFDGSGRSWIMFHSSDLTPQNGQAALDRGDVPCSAD